MYEKYLEAKIKHLEFIIESLENSLIKGHLKTDLKCEFPNYDDWVKENFKSVYDQITYYQY